MLNANRLELHYYFNDGSHEIDSLVRNKCEAEILAIIYEASATLGVDAQLVSEAFREGGFRDVWKLINDNSGGIAVILMIVQLAITIAQPFNSEDDELEKELTKLSLEEKKLSIEKLKKELQYGEVSKEDIAKVSKTISDNLKIIKRKSNFYSHLNKYPKVNKVGIDVLNDDFVSIARELTVKRSDFQKFILKTNKLKSEIDENAAIEIVAPVLKEGRYKWKGIYKDETISFDMRDYVFKDSVIFDNIPFQHGSAIKCVLVIERELDEIGDVKITGYAVTTVLEKIDGDTSVQTTQGKKYLHTKKLREGQGELFKKRP